MPLKYSFTDIFKGKFPNPKKLFDVLEDLGTQIDAKTVAEPIHAYNINLNKTSLKKEFGDAKKFKNIGIIHNKEGSYIIVADKDGHWLYYTLNEV